jgi:hypothetical protein
MRLIETSHLKTWAGSKPAESRFPYFVKQLIRAVINPEKLQMPSGDASWVPGFDGVVVNHEENQFVPIGLSVWELGTDDDIKGKADDDYDARSEDKAQDGKKGEAFQKFDRSQATYVFATPRVWANKDKWVSDRKAEGIWKDIVVIDGVVLQDWLEVASAVSLQFAAELGLVPERGLQTPDQAWGEWSYLTEPPTSVELVTAGRDEQVKEVISRLIEPPSAFTIRGDSPREAWGFALAAIRGQSEEERESLHARTIVADNKDVAGALLYIKNLIIVLKQAREQVSGYLSSRGGCHVIVPEGNDSHSERNVIKLMRPMHRQFAEALGHMGLSEERAERATRECGLSVTILQRQLHSVNYEPPRWCDEENVIRLLPAVLAGRWNDRNEDDREILCRLADTEDYDTFQRKLQRFLGVDEPPIQNIGEMWTLTAPADAFQLTARYLTRAHLERFKVAFQEVFGKIDPKVEISPDEWFYFDIKGKQGHSGWLRSGMAETLLLIAERGTNAKLGCVQSPNAFAEEVVRGLSGLDDDWRVLASLRDQYARLMEAAPGPFLGSLERLMETRSNDIRRLFAEEQGVLGGGAMHTGLLWGLETMAWSPDYLSRVALILAKLARLDPGGRMSNRPINSLRNIFLWWYPCTNAPLDRRLAVIDLILAREPVIGWNLLSRLLPDVMYSSSSGTAKPRWRDFGDLPEDARTWRGQVQYAQTIIDRALDHIGSDPERWRAILGSLRTFNSTQQKQVLDLLNAIAQGPTPADVKSALWVILRDFTHQHRMFKEAKWALTGELIDRLEAFLPHLAPSDPIERNRWLFDEWLPDLPSDDNDIKQSQESAEKLRQGAIAEILAAQGVEGLVKLGTTCKFPFLVAFTAVPLLADLDAVHGFVEQAVSAGEAGVFLAGQISGQAQRLYGEEWCGLVRKEAEAGTWPPVVIAALLMWWPDERATWEDTETLGVAAEYWHRKPVLIIKGTPEEQVYQVDRLIEVGRAAEAFARTSHRGEGVPTEALVRLFDAAFNELAQAQTAEEIRRLAPNFHSVRNFLGELHKRADLPREELARREYRALPFLESRNMQGLVLHEFMAEDPNFFVELLCDAFLPAHRDKSVEAELTPEAQARAQAAFTLLRGMARVPGQRDGNQIDEQVLLQWVKAVRKRATDEDRAVIADQHIGQVLAHSPSDPHDGGWPHRIVRNVLEELAADDIDGGLMVERFNMRGVYTKAMYEGGAQERVLASQYRDWADISRARWPRIARILEMIAQNWEKDARREDEWAEQEKLD